MDKETQLSNVAFVGAWSEEIAGQKKLQRVRRVLEEAVERCGETDLRENLEVAAALQLLVGRHPKGEMLKQAWERAYNVKEPSIRQRELQRLSRTVSWLSKGY